MVKVKNKTMPTILSFIRILYLKQRVNNRQCFCSLKFEKSLYGNKLSSCIFHSNMIVYTAEKVQ